MPGLLSGAAARELNGEILIEWRLNLSNLPPKNCLNLFHDKKFS
jgi:hypothetical protein